MTSCTGMNVGLALVHAKHGFKNQVHFYQFFWDSHEILESEHFMYNSIIFWNLSQNTMSTHYCLQPSKLNVEQAAQQGV